MGERRKLKFKLFALVRPVAHSILQLNKYYKRFSSKGVKIMGLSSKKQKDIPKELQPFHTTFETVPAFDNSERAPKTGIGIPTEEAVEELKAFMNVNKQ